MIPEQPHLARRQNWCNQLSRHAMMQPDGTARGAAPASDTLLHEMSQTFPGCQILAAFGQTAMSPVTCVLLGHDAIRKLGSVGKVVPTVAQDGLTLADLDTFLSERLARYKHPKALEIVDALPRNPAGKVLKTDLRARFAIRAPKIDDGENATAATVSATAGRA